MTNATVAKRTLLDGREALESLCETIYLYAIQVDEHGDLIRYHYSPVYAQGPWWGVSMSAITIDGYTTENQDHYGTYIFGWKDDEAGECLTDEDGTCRCRPREYMPRRQEDGEICEACWLKYGIVTGRRECALVVAEGLREAHP